MNIAPVLAECEATQCAEAAENVLSLPTVWASSRILEMLCFFT